MRAHELRWLLFAIGGMLVSTFANWLRAGEPAPIEWQMIAKSVEGRPIEIAQFGEGARGYLVVGPLHGDEREASELVERMAAHLAKSPPQLAGKRITVVRDPNPDGTRRGRPENARGVDLDRNFATVDWQRVSWGNHWVSGRAAESEPETRAIAALVVILRPSRIVHVREARRAIDGSVGNMAGGTPAARRSRSMLSVAGPAEEIAARISRETGLSLLATDPGMQSGSLTQFAAADRRISTLTLWAERGNRLMTNGVPLLRALLMALDFEMAPPSESAETALPVKPAASVDPGNVRVLSVNQLLQGAPLAPVVSARATALRHAANAPQRIDVAAPPKAQVPVPPTASVHPAVVTEVSKRSTAAPARKPEKPIPVPPDTDSN